MSKIVEFKISKGVTVEEDKNQWRNQFGECYLWSKEEQAILRKNYASLEKQKLLELLPIRTWRAIKTKAYFIGLHRHPINLKSETVANMSESERGYLAGAIDCDGYISLMRRHGRPSFQLWVGVSNTHFNLVEKCQNIADIGTISTATKGHKNPSYTWTVHSFSGSYSLLKQIEPLLVRKRRQAQLGLRFIEIRNKILRVKSGLSYTAEQLEIYKEMRRLNGGNN